VNECEPLALTLALSQRERGLTEVFFRDPPTWNIQSNSGFKHSPIGSLSQRERD
jgi:hypothetical protein